MYYIHPVGWLVGVTIHFLSPNISPLFLLHFPSPPQKKIFSFSKYFPPFLSPPQKKILSLYKYRPPFPSPFFFFDANQIFFFLGCFPPFHSPFIFSSTKKDIFHVKISSRDQKINKIFALVSWSSFGY